jgi:hypothetical protein
MLALHRTLHGREAGGSPLDPINSLASRGETITRILLL